MNLKTSFCNKSIIKSDFKRLWWISALHTLILFLTSVYPFIDGYYDRYIGISFLASAERFVHSNLYRYSSAFYVLALIVPVFLGVFLFSYLQSGKPSTFSHSLPVLRKTHYISHCISGIIMFLLPIVINSGILLLMRFDSGFATTFKISHLLIVIGISALYSLLAFSGAVFVSMLTANVVASALFTYVFAFLPIVCEAFFSYFLSTQLFGFPEGELVVFEKLYFSPIQLLEYANILVYLVLSALFIIAGYLLYKTRKLENHSEVVAFSVLRPVFIYGAGIALGCIGFAYFHSLWNVSSALALIPLGILGIITATMIVKKSFRIFSSVIKPLTIYTLAILALFLVLNFDLTGYETRVPDPEKVAGVIFNTENIDTFQRYTAQGERVYQKNEFTPYITGEEVIKSVTNFHSEFVKNTKEDDFYKSQIVYLKYNLKNGRTIERSYRVDFEKYQELLAPICESAVLRELYFPVLRNGERTYEGMLLQDERIADQIIDPSIYDEVLSALKADLKAVSFSDFASKRDTIAQIFMTFKEASIYNNGTEVPVELLSTNSESYNIRASYVNTIGVLEKYGLWKPYPNAEDIYKIGVNNYETYRNTESGVVTEIRSINGTEYDLVIEKPEDIKAVFEYVENLRWIKNYGTELVFYLHDGTSFRTEIDSDMINFPELSE